MAGPMRIKLLLGLAIAVLIPCALAACDQQSANDSAVANPDQFTAATQRANRSRNSGDNDDEESSASTTGAVAPGVGLRHGSVRGVNAGHLALQLVLESVITPDGELLEDRLHSAMNMDLIEQAVSTYQHHEAPEGREAQLAYYCNAYNANALSILLMFAVSTDGDLLASGDDFARIKSSADGAVASEMKAMQERFDDSPVLLGETSMTMRELRETHIFGFDDPRVLAYLIDIDPATPRLSREALWSRQLDAQLDGLCTQWVNSGKLARVEAGSVRIGPLLERHAERFDGDRFGDVLGFLRRYAAGDGPIGKALSAGQPSASLGEK